MIMTLLKRAGSAALLAAAVAFGSSAVGAAPLTNQALSQAANSGSVMQVRDRYYGGGGDWHRGGRHRYHNDGWNSGAYLGLGIAGAIIGGALSDDGEGYDEGDGYYAGGEGSDMGMRRCAAQFRSFEPETGYYTTFEGQKRLCPYLG
jgi:hypothetical protein